jgi:hypothetical protein
MQYMSCKAEKERAMIGKHVLRALARLAGPVAVVAAVAATVAASAGAAPPAVTAIPTIQGNSEVPFVGDTLTATNGTWTGSPTRYAYQWDRCNALGDRVNCRAIAGATRQSYTVQDADAGRTLRVRVTATNADGSTTKDSKGSGIVSTKTAPKVYARPQVTGSPSVGSTLTTTSGTWAGATSFTYQWQQCDAGGNNCANITGATGKSYGVRSDDVGHELRAVVTATNRYGSTKAPSNFTPAVTATPSTTIVTTTVAGNKAPSVRFLSLKVRRNRVYARFRICDDSFGRVKVIERDSKARRLAYTRRFAYRPAPCGTYARSWSLIRRFRTRGRFVVTLRAVDPAGRLSRLAGRSVFIR